MTTASISLQDLRQRLYVKAKAEKPWRVWGLYVPRVQGGDTPCGLCDGQEKQRSPRH